MAAETKFHSVSEGYLPVYAGRRAYDEVCFSFNHRSPLISTRLMALARTITMSFWMTPYATQSARPDVSTKSMFIERSPVTAALEDDPRRVISDEAPWPAMPRDKAEAN